MTEEGNPIGVTREFSFSPFTVDRRLILELSAELDALKANGSNGKHKVGFSLDALVHDCSKGENLERFAMAILGKDEMAHCGGRWRSRIGKNPSKMRRVLSEMRMYQKEGVAARNPGALAEKLWGTIQ